MNTRCKLYEGELIMSVKTSVFGSIRLSGSDAEKFQDQVKYGRSTKAARDTLARGTKMLSKYDKDGHVRIKVKRPA